MTDTSIGPETPAADTAVHPLSYVQQQLWSIHDLRPDTTEYNEIWPVRIHGALDGDRAQSAVNEILRRHDALRSSFPADGGTPVCRILDECRLPLLPALDLDHVPGDGRDQLVARLTLDLAEQPFDLREGPLVRGSLLRLGPENHVLLIATHHMVADGRSLEVFLDEFARLYADPTVELPPVPRYSEFVSAQRNRPTSERREDEDFWRSYLAGAPDVLDLRPGRLRPAVKQTSGARLPIDLDPTLIGPLRRRAAEIGATMSGVLLAAFGVVASRYAGRDDLVLGTGSEGRLDERYEQVIGYFANTVAIRLRPEPQASFAVFAREVCDVVFDAFDHEQVPFSRLVDIVGARRDLSFGPLVQVVFKTADYVGSSFETDGIRLRYEETSRTRSRFDLITEVQLQGDQFRIWVEYDDTLFDEPWIRRFFSHYENLLAAALGDPDRPVGDLPMLTERERGGWMPRPERRGAPVPFRDVVLTPGGHLAPAGAVGVVHRVDPCAVHLVGDRVEATDATPPVRTEYCGRSTADGSVVQLGPSDRFPVVAGLVVPLDEVRAVLAAHPMVRRAEVRAEHGDDGVRLVADVVPSGTSPLDWETVRAFAARQLPRYALPTGRATPSARPATATAEADGVAGIVGAAWCASLDRGEVRPDDEFFAVGGHSMAASRLAAAIRDELNVTFPVRVIFENPVFEDLVAAVRSAPRRTVDRAVATPVGSAPLTAAQEQIWVMEQLAHGRPVYHSPVVVDIRGDLAVDAFREAFDLVVARHEALRVGYLFESTRPVQRLLSAPRMRVIRLTALPTEHAAAEAARIAHDDAVRPFALDREPGVRATLLVLDQRSARLVLTIHHLAMDGVGFGVLLDELGTAYRAIRAGSQPELPTPDRGWMQYAAAEQLLLHERRPELTQFWRTYLDGLPEPRVPDGASAGNGLTFAGGCVSTHLTAEDTRTFDEVARTQRVTPFVLATAALVAGLHVFTGAIDVPVGAAMENRVLPGSARLVGCATNLAVLRVRCGDDPTVADLLARVRAATLSAQAHQELPFPEIVKAAGVRRTSGLPLVGVTTEWQDMRTLTLDLADCETSWRFQETGTARNDLVFVAARRSECVELTAEFNPAVWSAATTLALLDHVALTLRTDPAQRLSGLRLNR
jgi:hypothetical protein